MPAKKLTATDSFGITHTRQTARSYSHAVVIRPSPTGAGYVCWAGSRDLAEQRVRRFGEPSHEIVPVNET